MIAYDAMLNEPYAQVIRHFNRILHRSVYVEPDPQSREMAKSNPIVEVGLGQGPLDPTGEVEEQAAH